MYELVAQDKLVEVTYQLPSRPITPLDTLYGYADRNRDGNTFHSAHYLMYLRNLNLASLPS